MGCPERMFEMVIVGGGPAGMAPLLAAHRDGKLNPLLARGVAIIEQAGTLGSGSLGNYAINSDSSGRSFADCLLGPEETELTRLTDHPLTRQIAGAGDDTVPLAEAGRFLGLVGEALQRIICQHSASAVMTGHSVDWARRAEGGWHLHVNDLATGQQKIIRTRTLVVATGAHQPSDRLAAETINGLNLQERCGDRLMQSGDVLTPAGLARVAGMLTGKTSPRVAIVGGSTSAAAVAHALLNRLPDVAFGSEGISLLHRRPLRIYYTDRASAESDGYTEWTEDDVCPVSGRVFRFAGFRLDSRELVMQARGIGGRSPEPRLRLHDLSTGESDVTGVLDGADVVIAALGYRPKALPMFDHNGAKIRLMAHTGPQAAMVDRKCRVMDENNLPVGDLYGIGLAAGFLPSGPLGGEPSFRGQANGLWLWQHDVGLLIVDAVSQDWIQQKAIPARRLANTPPVIVPFTRPAPPRLSEARERLREIEDRAVFSNFGPVNTTFEQDMLAYAFAGEGACMTVCNATIGLMLAVQQAIGDRPKRQRYALMPSFTFAATAHAALWCGLTPLFCDVDPVTWAPCPADEERLLAQYGDDIAVVMPYATFGYDIDLKRYEGITQRYHVPVVVDAAASLGTFSENGRGFGAGFTGLIVFSMHATKSFASGEAGLVYSADKARIRELRQMSNFGFGQPRSATMAGLNGKLTEVGALLAHLRLPEYEAITARRAEVAAWYRKALPELTYQPCLPGRQAHQFAAGLLPLGLAAHRAQISAGLTAEGIGPATYFSPHLAQQEYFTKHAVFGNLPVTDNIAGRMLSLPLFDSITAEELAQVAAAVRRQIARFAQPAFRPVTKRAIRPVTQVPVMTIIPAAEARYVSNNQAP